VGNTHVPIAAAAVARRAGEGARWALDGVSKRGCAVEDANEWRDMAATLLVAPATSVVAAELSGFVRGGRYIE